MDKVAVVILNYNGKKYLQQFLPLVIKYSVGHKIIVGDNASTDDSVNFIKSSFPEVQLIVQSVNEGFSKGYNSVLNQVKAQYYILLNSDVEVTDNWIHPIIELMDQDPSIAACQPKILSYYSKDTFEYAGAAGGFIDILGYPFCRGRIFNTLEKDTGQYDGISRVFWATGACLFIKSEIYHQFKGFDDHFFAHMEEIDLCWRLNKAGYKVMFHSQSKIYHIGGGTLPKDNPHKTYLNFRNSLLMLYKNTPKKHKSWIFFLRFVTDMLAALYFMLTGNLGSVKAVYLAYFKFFFKMTKIKEEISGNAGRTLQYRQFGMYYGSIIVEHFLKKKKFFSDLKFKNTKRGYFFF
jgi:GT2 family glycosyltransferase